MCHGCLCLYLCQQPVGSPIQGASAGLTGHCRHLVLQQQCMGNSCLCACSWSSSCHSPWNSCSLLRLLLCLAPLALECLGVEGTRALALGRARSLMPLDCLAHPVWWSLGR